MAQTKVMKYPDEIVVGDDHERTISFDDGTSAIDITGWTVYFTVKQNETDADADALIQKTITSHTDAANGETTLSLTDTDTDVAPGAGTYFYDLQVTKADGKKQTLLKGEITFTEGITDA